jgi:hypothetical protein
MSRRNLTTNFEISATRRVKRSRPVLAEHSLAALASPLDLDDGRTLPAGAAGSVVGIWAEGKAYEVEFVKPFHAVVTVPAHKLLPATDAA